MYFNLNSHTIDEKTEIFIPSSEEKVMNNDLVFQNLKIANEIYNIVY